jgi:hypothetical protein
VKHACLPIVMEDDHEGVRGGFVSPAWVTSVQSSFKISIHVACFYKNLRLDCHVEMKLKSFGLF